MHATLLFPLLAAVSAVAAVQKCYGLDGTELDSKTFTPCKSSGKHSGCCATGDMCLDNGLCMATNDIYMGSIFQNGCTDPTGKDASCPRLCPDVTTNFEGLNRVAAWNIQTCDYGSYCCRAANDRTNCCNNSTAPAFTTTSIGSFTFQTATTETSSTPTAASQNAAITSSTPAPGAGSAAPDVSTSGEDVCKKEKEKTARVGGAVGGILGAALIGMMGAMLWMHKKEKRQRRLKEHYEEQFSNSWAYRATVTTSSSRDIDSPIEKQSVMSEGDESPRLT